MEPREALARAMRSARNGTSMMWPPQSEVVREAWLAEADKALANLKAAGFTIARADGKKETKR